MNINDPITIEPGNQSDAVLQIGHHFHELTLPQLLTMFHEAALAIQKIDPAKHNLRCPIENCLNCSQCGEFDDGLVDGLKEGREEAWNRFFWQAESWLARHYPDAVESFQERFEETTYETSPY